MARTTGTPPARAPLSRARVVTAALELIDSEGLDATTMRALGRRLGVDPMAVYHYLPNKAALFDAVVEAVWSEVRVPEPTGRWQDDLSALAHAIRAVLTSHANALPVLATRSNLSSHGLELLDTGIALLRRAGLAPEVALELLGAASAFIVGHALTEVGGAPDGAGASDSASLEDTIDPDAHPHLAVAVRNGAPRFDVVFERGLSTLISGVEASVDDHVRGS